jgi:glycosyltransferase involved in cell wall biosynthesis
MHPFYVNGRFLTQPFSGVQRFATEVSAALLRIDGATTLLAPPGVIDRGGASIRDASIRTVGRRGGQAWEQLELPGHARNGVLLNLGNTAPLRLRRQVVVIHDCGVFSTPQAYSWKFRAWYKLMQTALARSGARIVTVSAFSRAEIVRHLGVPAERVAVMPEGGDHMRRVALEPGAPAAFGLEPGRYVLVVGNLAAHKNLGALGELARMLAERGMVLAVAGGLDRGVFDGRSGAGPRLPQPARYLGRVSDGALGALYRQAACFVFPSLYEGFGLPALEAMECGCPVVASDIPALREVCGDAALFCDPASPPDFARQVGRLLDEAGRADQLREAATARLSRYGWDNAALALHEVVRELLPVRRLRAPEAPWAPG